MTRAATSSSLKVSLGADGRKAGGGLHFGGLYVGKVDKTGESQMWSVLCQGGLGRLYGVEAVDIRVMV